MSFLINFKATPKFAKPNAQRESNNGLIDS